MRLNLDPTALKSSYTFLKLSTAVLPPSGRLPIVRRGIVAGRFDLDNSDNRKLESGC